MVNLLIYSIFTGPQIELSLSMCVFSYFRMSDVRPYLRYEEEDGWYSVLLIWMSNQPFHSSHRSFIYSRYISGETRAQQNTEKRDSGDLYCKMVKKNCNIELDIYFLLIKLNSKNMFYSFCSRKSKLRCIVFLGWVRGTIWIEGC